MLDLVGKPDDRFSHDEAHMIRLVLLQEQLSPCRPIGSLLKRMSISEWSILITSLRNSKILRENFLTKSPKDHMPLKYQTKTISK